MSGSPIDWCAPVPFDLLPILGNEQCGHTRAPFVCRLAKGHEAVTDCHAEYDNDGLVTTWWEPCA